jgi:hypothetical protein
MVGDKAQMPLEDQFVFDIEGDLDYIELFVAGHKPTRQGGSPLACGHEDAVTNCDGREHVTSCLACGSVVSIESCPDAGTWPGETFEEMDARVAAEVRRDEMDHD